MTALATIVVRVAEVVIAAALCALVSAFFVVLTAFVGLDGLRGER
jgi:hypothetical protein